MTTRPSEAEYNTYFSRYVSLVPEVDIRGALEDQLVELADIMKRIAPDREKFRYAPGKWSIREVLGHLIDAERVFGHRAFCISRGESANLPSFDENIYVGASRYDERSLADLLAEFASLRRSQLQLYRWLAEKDWMRTGTAGDNPVSVRALAYITAGHVRHHLNILRDRYGMEPGT